MANSVHADARSLAPLSQVLRLRKHSASARVWSTTLLALLAPAYAHSLATHGRRALYLPVPTGEGSGYVDPGHQHRGDASPNTGAPAQPFKPVRTAEELRAALGQFDRIGVASGEVLQLCWPIRVTARARVNISCQGATLDMRCAGSGLLLERSAELVMQDCNVVWPLQQQFFNAAGPGSANMQLAEGSLLTLRGAVQTANCDVRRHILCILLTLRAAAVLASSQAHPHMCQQTQRERAAWTRHMSATHTESVACRCWRTYQTS